MRIDWGQEELKAYIKRLEDFVINNAGGQFLNCNIDDCPTCKPLRDLLSTRPEGLECLPTNK